jgi:hypothetical protein
MSGTNPHSPEEAEAFDTAMRWHVTSRTNSAETYLVDIGAYSGSGRCVCPDFACRFEPILSRLITAEQAVAQGLVNLRPYHFGEPKNALRCAHIMRARGDFADAMIAAMVKARAAQVHRPEAD